MQATIPCTSYPRLEDCLVNQVLLQGLSLAGRLTGESMLRVRLSRLISRLEESVSFLRLDAPILQHLHREMDRLTSAYQPAVTIEMLLAGEGISLGADQQRLRLPGFLFDMNRFFQALLSRFLKEHLTEYEVRDQSTITDMLCYDPGFNPRGRRAPAPRPDYVIIQHGQIASILDAKYRDLWELDLPAHWLYQLAIYALSRQQEKSAVILYPTMDEEAREARIVLSEPAFGTGQAIVVLRPVNLLRLEQLVTGTTAASNERKRRAFAEWLVFGETEASRM